MVHVTKLTRFRLAWLFALLVLVGQTHVCAPIYRLADGQSCTECVLISADDCDPVESVAATHNDCHDCCTVSTCEDPSDDRLVAPPSVDFALVTLTTASCDVVNAPLCDSRATRQLYLRSHPPTGPPLEHSSRAPPFRPFV